MSEDIRKIIDKVKNFNQFVNESVDINNLTPITINVMGKQFTWNELNGGKLYHGSRTELNVGDLLIPQKEQNFKESDKNKISITSDYNRAKLWVLKIKSDNPIFIYEIEPISDIEIWRVSLAKQGTKFDLWEGRVDSAKILKKDVL